MNTVEDFHHDVERQVLARHAEVVDLVIDRIASFKARTHVYVLLDPLPAGAVPIYDMSGPFEVYRAGRWHPSEDSFAQATMHRVAPESVNRFVLHALGSGKTGGTLFVPVSQVFGDREWRARIGLIYQARHPRRSEEPIKLDELDAEIRKMLRR